MTSEETLLFSSPTKREEIYNRFKLARLSKLYVRILCLALFSIWSPSHTIDTASRKDLNITGSVCGLICGVQRK